MIETCLSVGYVWGCPFHGVVEDGNQLTLPNSTMMTWPVDLNSGDTYPIRIAGLPAISRSPAEAADDAARGFEWRTDAIFAGRRAIHGYQPGFGNFDFVYIDSLKRVWAVTSPTDIIIDAGNITADLQFTRLFRLQAYPEDPGALPTQHTVAIGTLADYGDDVDTYGGAFLVDVAPNGQAFCLFTTCGHQNLYSVIRYDIADNGAADEQDLIITVTPTLVAAQSACQGTIGYQATQTPPGYARYQQVLSGGNFTGTDTGSSGICTPPTHLFNNETRVNTPANAGSQVVVAKETWVEVVGRVRHAWFDDDGDLHLVKIDFYWYDFYDSYYETTWPVDEAITTWDSCGSLGGAFNINYVQEAQQLDTFFTGHWTQFDTRVYDDVASVDVDSELQFYQTTTMTYTFRAEPDLAAPWQITQTSQTFGPLTKFAKWVIGGEEQDLSHLSESTINAIIAVNTTLHGARIANVNTLWPGVLDSYDIHPTQKGAGQPDNPTERVQVFRRANNLAHWCWTRRARVSPSLVALMRYAAVMLTPSGVDSQPAATEISGFEAPSLYYTYNPNTHEVRRDSTFPVCWV